MEGKDALFDMDDTIADYLGAMRRNLMKITGGVLPEDFHSDSQPDWMKERIELIRGQKGWWYELPVIESGLALMRLCVDIGYNTHILTQGPKNAKHAWGEKFEWCEGHVKPIAPDYTFTITRGGKGFYYGRIFVDDYPPYMTSWLAHRKRGLGLMPWTKDNEGFSHPQVVKYDPDIDRWRSAELEDKLHAAFNRGPEESIF